MIDRSSSAPPDLSWLGEGVASGLTIVAVVAFFGWVRSKWRQREQIAYLRDLFHDTYARMSAEPEQQQNEFFWLLAILDTSLHHRAPDLSYERLGELRNILAKADSTQKRSGIGSGPNMARYEWLLFEKVEAVEWLQLDFASVRDQFSN